MDNKVLQWLVALPATVLLGLIKVYRYAVSPWLGSNCRFHPTCSSYAEQAIKRYGFIKGGYLSVRRLIKCHPFHPGGEDPVPGTTNQKPEN